QKLRQEALAREAERQRILAAQQFAALQEGQRIQLEKQRLADQLAAHQRLVAQADTAFNGGNIPLSVQIYESALHLRQSDDVYRKLAKARLELDRVTQKRQLEEAKLKQLQVARLQEQELAKVRAQLDAERT